MPRTLIVYLHGIGDNIMLSGVLKEYCRLSPDEMIDLVVLNEGCAAVWKNNKLINSVIVYTESQPHFWNPLKFYLSHQWRVWRYIRNLNQDGHYNRIFFPSIQTLPEIIYHLTGTYGRHKIDRICDNLNLTPQLYPYDLHTVLDDQIVAEAWLNKFHGAQLAVLHPFSGHTKKRISSDDFELILESLRRQGFSTLVVGATAEKQYLNPSWKTESAFGLSIGVLIEILRRSRIFAGTDSAVAHFAAFANTRRVVIFSPKLEPRRYQPISEHGKISIIRIRQGQEKKCLNQFSSILSDV